MSRRAVRTWLWIAALVTIPVVYLVPETERAPTLRLAFITAIMSAVYLTEGAGMLLLAGLMATLQLVIWSLLLFAGAAIVSRPLMKLPHITRTVVTLTLVAVMIGASFFEIYYTPISSTRMRSSLLHVFE